jgi:NTE family protein
MINGKKIALVLGGGGTLGVAHIGVIKALEENNINIDIVCGTSMGAVVGGYFASGATGKEIEEFAYRFKRKDIVDVKFDFFASNSLLKTDKVTKLLKFISKEKKIEDCKIKFVAVSVDIEKGNLVLIDKGYIWEAMRASMSVPGVFAPFKMGEMLLVDGGVKDNVPVDIAKSLGADYIIAVDVLNYDYLKYKNNSIFNILLNSYTLQQIELVKYQTKDCNCLIRPILDGVTTSGYKKEEIDKCIKVGYNSGLEAVKKIKKDLNL